MTRAITVPKSDTTLADLAPLDAWAHLCVDMQKLFDEGGLWPAPWMRRVAPVVAALCDAAPECNVFARFVPPRRPRSPGVPGRWRDYFEHWHQATLAELDPKQLELIDELARVEPSGQHVQRAVYSAFGGGSGLHALLRRRRVRTLIVSGAETDVCVLATVLSAVDLGYRVIVAADAVCSSDDACHDRSLGLYRNRFSRQVEVVRSGVLLAAIGRDGAGG